MFRQLCPNFALASVFYYWGNKQLGKLMKLLVLGIVRSVWERVYSEKKSSIAAFIGTSARDRRCVSRQFLGSL